MSKSTQNGSLRGQKQNNRKYPGVRGARPDLKQLRVKEAAERNAEYAKLSPADKAARNPKKVAKLKAN